MRYGIFTQKRHAEKLVNYLNHHTSIDYLISTCKSAPYEMDYDIGVCYGFPHLIDVSRFTSKVIFWYNYHPAPLPDYGDWGNYARGLHDLRSGKIQEWGVSLHVIDEGIDSGTVLRVLPVPLMSIPVDHQELGDIGHYYMFQLFKQTIEALEYEPLTKEELDDYVGKYVKGP